MGAKAVIAITPDRALGKTLRIALTAAGAEARAVNSASDLPRGRIDAALAVVHQPYPDPDALRDVARRMPEDGHLIVLLPRGDLGAAVAAMDAHERVAGVLGAECIRAQEVTAMATRLLFGDIFGLRKVLPWGARIHRLLVGDKSDKTAAIDEISSFATSIGVRRKYREAIEQCCDEMLMNALYDAPIDASGKPMASLPVRDRPPLIGDDRAIVEYGCDGHRFAVAVRDRFGRFERDTLIRYLDKCLHSSQQIDVKPGGAGLGLYLMSNSASTLLFNVFPGVATECVCTFDIDATKLELEQLGVFQERDRARRPTRASVALKRSDTTDIPPPAEPPRSSSVTRGVVLALGSAILVLLTASAFLAVPRLWHHFAGADAPPPAASPGQTAVDLSGSRAVAGEGALVVRSNVPARMTVEGADDCRDRELPASCRLTDGAHQVHLRGDDPRVDHAFSVDVRGKPLERTFLFGVVEARQGYTLSITEADASQLRQVAFTGGRQNVWVRDQGGARTRVEVPVHAGETILVP